MYGIKIIEMEKLYLTENLLKPYSKREQFLEINSKIDWENLDKLNIDELRTIARKLDVSSIGNKRTLVNRILNTR